MSRTDDPGMTEGREGWGGGEVQYYNQENHTEFSTCRIPGAPQTHSQPGLPDAADRDCPPGRVFPGDLTKWREKTERQGCQGLPTKWQPDLYRGARLTGPCGMRTVPSIERSVFLRTHAHTHTHAGVCPSTYPFIHHLPEETKNTIEEL